MYHSVPLCTMFLHIETKGKIKISTCASVEHEVAGLPFTCDHECKLYYWVFLLSPGGTLRAAVLAENGWAIFWKLAKMCQKILLPAAA